MKLASAGKVVLGMSASFILILILMMVALRPEPRSRPSAPTAAASSRPADPGLRKELERPPEPYGEDARPDPASPQATRQPASASTNEPPGLPNLPAAEQTQYWKLQQERKEVALLKQEMQERLKEKQEERRKQIARLADTCTRLKPDEAAQVLLDLDDATLKLVLQRMQKETAVTVAALLEALGRKDALSYLGGP